MCTFMLSDTPIVEGNLFWRDEEEFENISLLQELWLEKYFFKIILWMELSFN